MQQCQISSLSAKRWWEKRYQKFVTPLPYAWLCQCCPVVF